MTPRLQITFAEATSRLILIDSQAVKNTCNASVESKGFYFYKATNGIKRHLAVDTLGFPYLVRVRPAVKLRVGRIRFFVHFTKASLSDDLGLIDISTPLNVKMLFDNIDYFKSKPVNIPKITILLDNGYHPQKIMEELKKVYPAIMTKIRLKLSPKPSKAKKNKQGKTGFLPIKARWVIERSNSWIDKCKSLVKNFERTLDHAATKINMSFVRLMLKRLAAIA